MYERRDFAKNFSLCSLLGPEPERPLPEDAELTAALGSLERSLGLVTRDSPEGFVCSTALRGTRPPPSRKVIIPAGKDIGSSDRAQPIWCGDPQAGDAARSQEYQ